MPSPEEIESRFLSAGWHLDGGFTDYLVIGYSDEEGLSILARKEAWETDEEGFCILEYEEAREIDDDPIFELIDHEGDLTYGVWEIPTPEEAQQMLREHGQPPVEERY